MDKLSFQATQNNGLSFELLVNGESLCRLVGGEEGGIPYWLFENDLPYYRPFGPSQDRSLRIVCVCECGEYGCGHTSCRLVEEDGTITLQEFGGDVAVNGSRRSFTFEAVQYRQVVTEVVRQAKERQEADA